MATIEQNIARITQAKADIKTAIEAKGVTVDSAATIDAYADYVDDIPTGGGSTGAKIGDLVVYYNNALYYIPQNNYNSTTYPTSTYIPIGVIAEDYSGNDNTLKFISLNYMSVSDPDNGSAMNASEMSAFIYWGERNTSITSGITYVTKPWQALYDDIDGKTHTEEVLVFATGQSDWKTAATIDNTQGGAGLYPGLECSWRYHTSGTSQGDWYIPAIGELEIIRNPNNLSVLNSGLTLVGGIGVVFHYDNSTYSIASSSSYNNQNHYYFYRSEWLSTYNTSSSNFRAFCKKVVLPISQA